MRFEEIDNILSESNAERKAITRPLRDKYVLSNQKVTPLKKIILDNEAVKKLIAQWNNYRDSDDSLGKIMLNPDPKKGYGANGVYGVWEAVKGKEFMYADTAKDKDGVKWSFTECWLTTEGAKKLQNNIVPPPSDFRNGEGKMLSSYRETRRRTAKKYIANHPEEEKTLKDFGNTNKEDQEKVAHLSKNGVKVYGAGLTKDKKIERAELIENNFRKLRDKLNAFTNGSRKDPVSEKAWNLVQKTFAVEKYAKDATADTTKHKLAAEKIDELKAEIDNFLKSNK